MKTTAVLVALVALAAIGRPSAASRQTAPSTPAAAAQAPSAQRALLDKYCVTCHNRRTNTAGLTLDTFNPDDASAHPEVWEKVIRKVRGRMMPPIGMPRPDEVALDALASSLETSLDRAAASNVNPGHVILHRLNRSEYGNAIRDLLDLTDTDVAGFLPADDDSDGFDNVASVLKESPAFLEGYVGAAREAARLAMGDTSGPPGVAVYRLPTGAAQRGYIEGMPLGTRGGILVRRYFPADGEYRFDITLRQAQIYIIGLEFPHQLVMTIDGETVFTQPLGGDADLKAQDQELATGAKAIQDRLKNLRFQVKAGPHTVIVTFQQKTLAHSEEVLQPFAGTTRDHHPSGWANGVPSLEKLEVMGPYNSAGPGDTPSRRRILSCRPAGAAGELPCARTILAALAGRAYRRPVNDADLVTPLAFYQSGAAAGGFEAGIQRALTYILASPHFLYRAERTPTTVSPGSTHRISALELASRLSFFLWSSIPDDALLKEARAGTLVQPAVLDQQVRRMLADPKANALVTNFFAQWLRLRELATFDPDAEEFPDFEEDLRRAMQRELELFTGSVVVDDRSVLDLLTARDTFVNERLARHYGIAGIRGQQFRRVTLTDANRWGLLGKGSLLTITSYGNRTSPVLRGRFVLETILGTPPSPPPPNVPSLKENEPGAEPLSVRQMLEQHRANPACASCHRVMDPLGFSLENFDAIGQWRAKDHGVTVDASGMLFDGSAVSSPATLRQALMKRPQQFVGTMTERLLTYGLGRSLTYADMPTVRGIVRDAARTNYRFSSLVLAVVRSAPFQMRRVAEKTE